MPENSPYSGMENSRNTICQSIRNALATRVPPVSCSRTTSPFISIANPVDEFKKQFEANGGALRVFEMDTSRMQDRDYAAHQQQELYKYLKYELEMRRCATVLNTSPQLTQVLENFGIKTTGILQAATSADAVIVYSQFLIARSGGIVVSQRDGLMVYPSIKGLAKHIIVLSSSRNVLPDLNDLCNATVITSKEKNRAEEYDFDFDMAEIIHPTQVEDEAVSANSPKITLLLVEER